MAAASGRFCPMELVYYYFDSWKENGTIELIHESLVEKTRVKQ
jgi:transposase